MTCNQCRVASDECRIKNGALEFKFQFVSQCKLKLELHGPDNKLQNNARHSSTAPLRLFVAIPIPEPVRDEIIRVQQELQPLVPRDVARWARSDQFHLTLRFLGDVPADGVEDLKKSVGAVCRNARSLSLRAGGVGFFPNPRSPRVIWVGIDDRDRAAGGFAEAD